MYIVSASTLLAIVDVPGDRTIPTTWRYAPILVIERTVAACLRPRARKASAASGACRGT